MSSFINGNELGITSLRSFCFGPLKADVVPTDVTPFQKGNVLRVHAIAKIAKEPKVSCHLFRTILPCTPVMIDFFHILQIEGLFDFPRRWNLVLTPAKRIGGFPTEKPFVNDLVENGSERPQVNANGGLGQVTCKGKLFIGLQKSWRHVREGDIALPAPAYGCIVDKPT